MVLLGWWVARWPEEKLRVVRQLMPFKIREVPPNSRKPSAATGRWKTKTTGSTTPASGTKKSRPLHLPSMPRPSFTEGLVMDTALLRPPLFRFAPDQRDPILVDHDPPAAKQGTGRLLESLLTHSERLVDLLRRTRIT